MYIRDFYNQKRPVVSCEMFPPKKDADVDTIYAALEEICTLSPDFISVTHGAGGAGNVNRTGEVAAAIEKNNVPSLAHLTCITADKAHIQSLLDGLAENGVQNVLALRGDPPADGKVPAGTDYRVSADLIRDIKDRGGFCVGAACYPEGHIDNTGIQQDIGYLLGKQDAGADFLISQLFFDNDLFFRFLDHVRKARITLPISAGVMPILGRAQIERMIFMCGASLPSTIVKLLHKYENDPASLRSAGIEHAAEQLQGLIDGGVDGVHIYSMNKPSIAARCMKRIGRA